MDWRIQQHIIWHSIFGHSRLVQTQHILWHTFIGYNRLVEHNTLFDTPLSGIVDWRIRNTLFDTPLSSIMDWRIHNTFDTPLSGMVDWRRQNTLFDTPLSRVVDWRRTGRQVQRRPFHLDNKYSNNALFNTPLLVPRNDWNGGNLIELTTQGGISVNVLQVYCFVRYYRKINDMSLLHSYSALPDNFHSLRGWCLIMWKLVTN